jgi:hypothetical protein
MCGTMPPNLVSPRPGLTRNISIAFFPKLWFDPRIPSQRGGASRSSRTSGAGCGGRVGSQHGFHADERSDATVKSRGSGIPVLMPRAMRFTHCRGRDDAKHRRKTGARQPVPGKSAYKPQNHRAGKVGTFRPNLWYLPPAFFVAGGPWERPAPDLPCALTLAEGDKVLKTRAQRAARR